MQEIQDSIPSDEVAILTSLPRGTLQIAQPARLPETLLRAYGRNVYAHDKLSWRAILSRAAVTDADAWGSEAEFKHSAFFREYLSPAGLRHAVAAPLTAPVLEGYPGAVHVYRKAEHESGAFSSRDVEQLARFAREINAAAAADAPEGTFSTTWMSRPPLRMFIVDAQLRSHPTGDELNVLDERLRQQMVQHARHRLHHLNGDEMTSDRLQLPDGTGGLWTFRVITHREYPAIGEGPFVFFCLQPDCSDWSLLRPSDFAADPELSRLVPAMKFMQQEFHRSPSLKDISKQVHLSPFHFHRRFTDLLGLTPKHFLLDCQIFEAKRQLIERQKDLRKIAIDCGFAHQSHFTSRFKQATGLTPTRWRRMNSR